VSILDRLGQIPQGTALEEPFFALVRAGGIGIRSFAWAGTTPSA